MLCLSPRLLLRYTYGKPVVGATDVRMSIVGSDDHVIPLSPQQVLVSLTEKTRLEQAAI